MKLRHIPYLSLLFLSLITVSCKVVSPTTTEIFVPEKFARTENYPTDTITIADLRWQDFFKDKKLLELIKKAIEHNYDLQIAVKRIETAQEQLNAARMLELPTVNAAITAQSTSTSDNSLNGISLKSFLGQNHIEDYNTAISVSWEVDIWGKIRSQKEVLLNQYLQTHEARKAVQTKIISQVADGYYNLLMLDAQIETANKSLMLNDSIVKITKLQYDAGITTQLAVKQAEGQKQTLKVLIPKLEEQIAIQENALNIITGCMPDTILRSSSLLDIEIPDTLLYGFPAEILRSRPDVRAFEMMVRVRNAEVGIAQANMYPTLTISAAGGINSFRASNWFQTPASLFSNIMGGITQPLLQKRTLKTQFEVARIKLDESVIQFRQSVLDAVGEVSDALIRNELLKVQYNESKKNTDLLAHAVNDSKQLFKSGMANYLEVIIVQSNALQAELQQASIRRQQLGAYIDLYRALGGGWR